MIKTVITVSPFIQSYMSETDLSVIFFQLHTAMSEMLGRELSVVGANVIYPKALLSGADLQVEISFPASEDLDPNHQEIEELEVALVEILSKTPAVPQAAFQVSVRIIVYEKAQDIVALREI